MTSYAPTEVLAKIIDEYQPDISLRAAKTLDYLSAKGRVMTGTSTDLNWNVITGESATATVPMTTAGVTQATGGSTQAQLTFGTYKIYHQFDLSRVDIKNVATRSKGVLKNQMKFHVDKGLRAIRRQVNNYIWNATGSAGFGGFVGFENVYNNTLPYAAIDPAVFTNWVAIKNTNATPRNLTKKILYDFHRVLEDEEVGYDSIWTSPVTSQAYGELFDTIAGNLQIQQVTDRTTTDLAPSSRFYDGVPIRTDNKIVAGKIVCFDSSDVSLYSYDLSDADMGQLALFGMKDNFQSIAVSQVGGMNINIALLPQANPGVLTFQMFVLPQLKVANRRSVQVIDQLN
jgi:hypothetical protein